MIAIAPAIVTSGLLSQLVLGLVGLELASSTNQANIKHSPEAHGFTRRPGHQPGGWNNPKAFPLLRRRETVEATWRMMKITGWSEGKSLNYALEEALIMFGLLQPPRPPTSDSADEARLEAILDAWPRMNEATKNAYLEQYPGLSQRLIGSAPETKLQQLIGTTWDQMTQDVRNYWLSRFPDLRPLRVAQIETGSSRS